VGIVLGQIVPIAKQIEHTDDHGQGPEGPSGPGRYLARTVCSECHGTDLQGAPMDSVPPLTVTRAYSLEQFTTLLRTGVAIGGRTLGLMAEVARRRFFAFTDAEISQLYNYLNSYGLESRSNNSH
jgi:cytochrome c553